MKIIQQLLYQINDQKIRYSLRQIKEYHKQTKFGYSFKMHTDGTIPKQQIFILNEEIMSPQQINNYQNALKYSNLNVPGQLYMRNVKIYQRDYMHQLYTKNSHTIIDRKKLPHLVMMHGFGGTSLTFIRIFNYLFPYYQVHALDTFGVGYSSHGHYSSSFSESETIDYYVDAVQQWRKKVKIQQFQLVGHSFGGYLALHYALKYPKIVRRLVLLSPAGSNEPDFAFIKQNKENVSLRKRMFFSLVETLYGLGIRPMKLYNNYFLGDRFCEIMLGSRLKLEGQEKIVWRRFIQNIGQRANLGQKGFYKIFKWPVQPTLTIKSLLQTNKFDHPIQIYFGDKDWIYTNYQAHQIATRIKHVTVQFIKNAGHQLIFDNPFQVAQKITKFCRKV